MAVEKVEMVEIEDVIRNLNEQIKEQRGLRKTTQLIMKQVRKTEEVA